MPPSPTPTPLQWTDIEFLRAAPVPIPDGAPPWIYDSDLGIVYGQAEHPDLLLDFTKLEVNRSECNALLYAVGDVGEPTTIPLYGAALMAWWDKYGEDVEVPYFNLLARLTVTEYDAIAAELGIKPYAETYGTEGSNPHAQRKVEACAAGETVTMLPTPDPFQAPESIEDGDTILRNVAILAAESYPHINEHLAAFPIADVAEAFNLAFANVDGVEYVERIGKIANFYNIFNDDWFTYDQVLVPMPDDWVVAREYCPDDIQFDKCLSLLGDVLKYDVHVRQIVPLFAVRAIQAKSVTRLLYQYINDERDNEGLPPLQKAKALLPFAQAHTDDMALHDYLSHKDSNGNGFAARWEAWEDDECSKVSENLARVTHGVDQDDRPEREPELTAAAMVEGWMGSEGHRAAILTPEFTHTAIAVAYAYSPSREKNYAYGTQIFCVRGNE